MNFKDELKSILNEDPLGLLDVKHRESSAISADERLISSFNQINKFYDDNNREPQAGNGVQEHQLYARLKGIRASDTKIKSLKPLDKHGLLSIEQKEINSIDDIFESDQFGILENDEESIFKLKHVSSSPRKSTDFVAKRKQCKNFDEYEPLFLKVQEELGNGERRLRPFNDQGENLQAKQFYVLNGVLLYLVDIDITSPEKTINGKRFRKDGRTETIFENGTMSNMLYRSLAKALYQNGKIVTNRDDKLLDGFSDITEDDQEEGHIYILKSLSKDQRIQEINNLYKIGFTSGSVKQRVKNAEKDPTYLMAPVSIVESFTCYNFSAHKLEQLLRRFFGTSCLDIDINDNNGKRHRPQEWYVAPLNIIEEAIHYVLTEEIVNFKYDATTQEIINRKR